MNKETALRLLEECEEKARAGFKPLEETAFFNQQKVLAAFKKNRISAMHFAPTTGYGYNDIGREALGRTFADIFGCESAIVSPLIANGTHAISLALFGLLRPNDALLSITGKPYDTLSDVISGKNIGSLHDYNIAFEKIDLTLDGEVDLEKCAVLLKKSPKVVFIQRSKGYAWRKSLSIPYIKSLVEFVKARAPKAVILVDNCYGEFVDRLEPTEVGADVIVGSLIKNPCGGLAPTGGYVAGRADLIEQISYRLTAPSLGTEVGSYLGGYGAFFQGLFIAPAVVLNALKGSLLGGFVFEKLQIPSIPNVGSQPDDIIRAVRFKDADGLISFCRSVQAASPVDSYVKPEPWDMPGYDHKVIMAAGTFVQGASIELTADGAVRDPYIGYMQGGLTYEHCKAALLEIMQSITN